MVKSRRARHTNHSHNACRLVRMLLPLVRDLFYMTSFGLDETEEHIFEHAALGYGVEVSGGEQQEREEALRANLDGSFVAVECTDISSKEEFLQAAIRNARDVPDDESVEHVSVIQMEKALAQADCTFLVLEFDSPEHSVQTDIAQTMKGVSEGRRFDGAIGFSCEEGGSVVRAEPDLSMRVKSYTIDE